MSASEQTSASKREPGYYWITLPNEDWEIATYDEDGIWSIDGVDIPPHIKFEIDELRIERQQPDELELAVDSPSFVNPQLEDEVFSRSSPQLKNINMNNVGTEIQHNEMTAEEKLQVVQSKLWEANREIESLRK